MKHRQLKTGSQKPSRLHVIRRVTAAVIAWPLWQSWRQFLTVNRSFIIFIALMSVFRSACADWYSVPTGSMQPTIAIGDRITVNKMAYDLRLPFSSQVLLRLGEPQRGDIIVFDSEAAENRLIKRVVGVPGDKIAMRHEVVYLNGQPLHYSLASEPSVVMDAVEQLGDVAHRIAIDQTQPPQLANFADITVPADFYLVLGDNRRNSADSRVYGLVPRHEVRGKATYVAFSLDYDKLYLPRTERFARNLYTMHPSTAD
jgi:signal peptidase I